MDATRACNIARLIVTNSVDDLRKREGYYAQMGSERRRNGMGGTPVGDVKPIVGFTELRKNKRGKVKVLGKCGRTAFSTW